MSTFRGLGRSGIGDKLTRFGKGMSRVPGNIASAFHGDVPRALPSLGRAGQVGELTGMGLATGGMLAFPAGAMIAGQGRAKDKPNGGHPLDGAVHPDFKPRDERLREMMQIGLNGGIQTARGVKPRFTLDGRPVQDPYGLLALLKQHQGTDAGGLTGQRSRPPLGAMTTVPWDDRPNTPGNI